MKKIDFAVARVMHVAWKSGLRSFLDGKETLTEDQAVSHKDCDLGKWLYSEGMTKFGNLPEMKELEKIHVELHSIVKRVVQLKNSGNASAAEQEVAKIEPLSKKMFSLLIVIERKVE
jgi:methyl-accepting chemotaxis protein